MSIGTSTRERIALFQSLSWPPAEKRISVSLRFPLRPWGFSGPQVGGTQGRLQFSGSAELLAHAFVHLVPQASRLGVDGCFVDGRERAALQDPAAVDHHIGHRDAVLAIDDLFDDIIEGHKRIGIHVEKDDVGGLSGGNRAELASHAKRVGAA